MNEEGAVADQQEKQNRQFSFTVVGMSCISCVERVKKELLRVPGVSYVSVNLSTERAFVAGDERVTDEALSQAVQRSGYGKRANPVSQDEVDRWFRASRRLLWAALALTFPLLVLMMLRSVGFFFTFAPWIELVTSGAVIFLCGRKTLNGARIALLHFHVNMDTLLSLGALSAWGTTILHLSGVPIPSFGALGAMLLTLHLIGRHVEARLRKKASSDIQKLLLMAPPEACLLRGESHIMLPVEAFSVGDFVLVRAGERVPFDGLVVLGEGYVDESMLTGEPLPVAKEITSSVVGGSLLQQGTLTIEVTRVGEAAFLSQMIRLVEEAQASQIPIQKVADRLAKVFIPALLGVAIFGAVVWGLFYPYWRPFLVSTAGVLPWIRPHEGALVTAFFVFVSTLVIACPCALGLASPLALAKTIGEAAREGIFIKNGEALQSLSEMNVFFLDKTGTLTAGSPRVVSCSLPKELLFIAGALEQHSTHPLAQSVVSYARERGASLAEIFSSVKEEFGQGIWGAHNGQVYFVGRPLAPERYKEIMRRGESVIEVHQGGVVKGYLSLADTVEEGVSQVVEEIRAQGVLPIMLTGDQALTASVVGRTAGIEKILAGMSPFEKVDTVRNYEKKGDIIGMVGDGINDAGALKNADVGIALSRGSDLALSSADVVISRGGLSQIPYLIRLSKGTLSKIKQNLFFAFIYNGLAIPVALAGLIHPILGEFAMILSSFSVIINTLYSGEKTKRSKTSK